MDLEYDPETRRFAARVLREVADMLEGDEDEATSSSAGASTNALDGTATRA